MMFPPAPAFTDAVRLARLTDIPRIGVIAAAPFYHSSCFAYERPYFAKYPLDTLSSYCNAFLNALLDPDSVVLVTEDTLDQKEASHIYDALRNVYPPLDEQIPRDMLDSGRAIVSVATVSLLPNSSRHGQFQSEGRCHDLALCS